MKKEATRDAFGRTVLDLGKTHPEIVVMDADLAESTKTLPFAEAFPDRHYEFGIAEANMICTAAGMALAGKIPFICSFACFLTGRFDQIRVSVAFSRANVKLVGTHGGIGAGEDGYTQQGIEDVSLMRALPGMVVIQPADGKEAEEAVKYAVRHEGPLYLRLTRQKIPRFNEPGYRFRFGKGEVLREGKDLAIVASGAPVAEALAAAETLSAEGVDCAVLNIHTIKPIDSDLLEEVARKTGRILTVEDHTVVGGLGSAVCEALAPRRPVPVRRLGLQDIFSESGSPADLYDKYGISAKRIVEAVRVFLERPAG